MSELNSKALAIVASRAGKMDTEKARQPMQNDRRSRPCCANPDGNGSGV